MQYPNLKGVLFDKDGTLIDFNRTWLPLYRKAADYLARAAGRPDEADALLSKGGFNAADETWLPDSLLASGSNQQIYEAWSSQLNLEMSDEHVQDCYDIFNSKHGAYMAVLSDLNGFLDKLRERDLVLGVATMDDKDSAERTLEAMGCRDRFDFVCGAAVSYTHLTLPTKA